MVKTIFLGSYFIKSVYGSRPRTNKQTNYKFNIFGISEPILINNMKI